MRRFAILTVVMLGISLGLTRDLAAQTSTAAGSAPASPHQDTLIGSWQLDPASVADGASGLSLDWIRRMTGGRIFTAGGGVYSIGESRWFLARVGTAVRPTGKVTIAGQSSLGGGNVAGSHFGHFTGRGDLTIHAKPALSITLGDEYINIDKARGHLLRTSAGLRVSKSAAVDVSVATSAGGNLNTTFAVGRVDVAMRPVSIFGGGALGRTTPEVLALTGTSSGGQTLRQGFAGAVIPVRRVELRVVIDVVDLDAVTRRSLMLSMVVPVGR